MVQLQVMPNTSPESKGRVLSKRRNPYYQAQDILSRRDHSINELSRKLRQKKFNDTEIQAVVTWLIDHKLLNDEQFAKNYAESTLRFKAVGPRWLQQKLQQKGITSELALQAVAQAYEAVSEAEIAAQAAQSWQASHARFKDDYGRLQRFLLSRGFSSTVVSAQLYALRNRA